jgi:GAF domain-containing protein
MISLFGRHEQYILAEATRTLSLRDDTEHNSRDELWVGNCTMSYQRSFCRAVANFPPTAQVPADQVYEISDLAQDGAYKDHPDVTGYPNVRFLACVPIISPKGVVIGAYTILDDKPHGPLRTDHLDFLTDMATTVMDYLVTSRSISQHLRGERMIAGLGSFLEGKSILRTSWPHTTEELTELTDASQGHGKEMPISSNRESNV